MCTRQPSRKYAPAVRVAAPQEILSNRELQVFALVAQGLGTRKIAKKLHQYAVSWMQSIRSSNRA